MTGRLVRGGLSGKARWGRGGEFEERGNPSPQNIILIILAIITWTEQAAALDGLFAESVPQAVQGGVQTAAPGLPLGVAALHAAEHAGQQFLGGGAAYNCCIFCCRYRYGIRCQ